MKQKSWKKSRIKPYKLVLILGLIVFGIIAGKYLILAVSPPSWTEPTITAGQTLIRKVHIDELRTEINANRADVGLATTTWTDPTITAGQTLIRAAHFTESRTALEGIFTQIGDSLPSWTDATITSGTTIIRKTHLDELRASTTAVYDSINAKKCCGSYGGVDTGSTGACPGTDDSECGTIDCSGWYVQTGTEGVYDTEYCYNKQNITTNRCEEIDDCKDANTTDCDSQSNSTQQYSCELCKYIHDTNACYQTTLGSCSNYGSDSACGSGGSCCGYCSGGGCTYRSTGSTCASPGSACSSCCYGSGVCGTKVNYNTCIGRSAGYGHITCVEWCANNGYDGCINFHTYFNDPCSGFQASRGCGTYLDQYNWAAACECWKCE